MKESLENYFNRWVKVTLSDGKTFSGFVYTYYSSDENMDSDRINEESLMIFDETFKYVNMYYAHEIVSIEVIPPVNDNAKKFFAKVLHQ